MSATVPSTTSEPNEDNLLRTPLFSQVPPQEAALLLPSLRSHNFSKGDYIFRQRDTDHKMFLLESGRVKLTRESADERVQLLSIHGRGEILGEIPVFDPDGGSRTANAIVMTSRATVLSLTHEALFSWLREHPNVAINMLQVLANRMRKNNEHISDLVFTDVPGRLAKTLLDLATRFGVPDERGLIVPHDLTQEELAQLVGSSRETVNKTLMDFTARKWIAREGRTIIIFEPGKLIRRAQQ